MTVSQINTLICFIVLHPAGVSEEGVQRGEHFVLASVRIFQPCARNRQETGMQLSQLIILIGLKNDFHCFKACIMGDRTQNYFELFMELLLNILMQNVFHSSVINVVPQLSQRAREIYNSFLSSKATTPVNIDSQAQLADDILNAPRPDMFKEQQLQVRTLHIQVK